MCAPFPARPHTRAMQGPDEVASRDNISILLHPSEDASDEGGGTDTTDDRGDRVRTAVASKMSKSSSTPNLVTRRKTHLFPEHEMNASDADSEGGDGF